MIKRLSPPLGCRNKDAQLLAHFGLADKFIERQWPETSINGVILA
jgi:hypothetical protein